MMFGKANTIAANEMKSVSNAPQREKCNVNPTMEICPFYRWRITGSRQLRGGLLAAFVSLGGGGLARGLGLRFLFHRLALATDLVDRPLHEADLDAVGDFNPQFALADPNHLSDDPARRHHRVAALHRVDHRLVLFHPLLLRPENQEIENAEYQDEREQKAQDIAAASACGLSECRSNHQQTPW